MNITLDALPPEPKRKLTDGEYNFIYGATDMGRSPRICVDALVVKNGALLLAKRSIEPFKGDWTLPGGGIRFGETIDEALVRILKGEIGAGFTSKKLIGNIEHYPEGPNRHSISMAYLVEIVGEPKVESQASEMQFFAELPENTHQYQGEFLREYWKEIIG